MSVLTRRNGEVREFRPPKSPVRLFWPDENLQSLSVAVKEREKRVKVNSYASSSSSKAWDRRFWLFFVLFHLFGIETLPYIDLPKRKSKITATQRMLIIIWKSPKYIIRVILLVNLATRIFWLVVLPDTVIQLAFLFHALSLSFAYLKIYRNRRGITKTFESVIGVFEILAPGYTFKKYRYSVLLFFIYCQFLAVSSSILHNFTQGNNQTEQNTTNSTPISTNFPPLPTYLNLTLNIVEVLHNVAITGIVSLFVLYYSFTCKFLNKLFNEVLRHVKLIPKAQNYEVLLPAYEQILTSMDSLEDSSSFPTFLIVVNNTVGLFVVGYSLAFTADESYEFFFYSLLLGLQHMTFQIMIMLIGSNTVEAAKDAKVGIFSLPGKIPSKYEELKILMCRKFKRDSVLTLWNIYVLDRSLLLSSFGSLITYGILIGTLLKVQHSE
ncbi:hypothetical protein JTE90_024237 [Oedothorax gibbosus]|uniref:Gustatory receptor n=1 Tax=Oedothorax gibbosus TaxID=931172 RepID=A0AAV6TZ56_9ARAC|nr:hypothetical protein JTE90_024237 [Oedothorax gibbosus]